MGKYTVQFTIEADSLGHATNRALVALYRGDLDAEDVKVSKADTGKINVHVDDKAVAQAIGKVARGGYVQGGVLPPPANGHHYTKEEVDRHGGAALDQLKERIRKVRGNIPKEPHKDDVD